MDPRRKTGLSSRSSKRLYEPLLQVATQRTEILDLEHQHLKMSTLKIESLVYRIEDSIFFESTLRHERYCRITGIVEAMQSGPSRDSAGDNIYSFPFHADVNLAYKPSSMLHQPSLAPFPMNSGCWGGVGGFATPAQPAPPLCAPPLTIASSLGNPQMPASSTYNTSSSMDFNFRLSSTHMAPAFKRKAMEEEDMDERMPVAKQLITEDKVSASLNSLHLSNKFTSHKLGADDPKSLEKPLVKDGSDDSDSDGGHLPRLYVSEDINKIPVDDRNALPEALLKNLRREGPCLEVVLWQPPTPLVSTVSPPASNEENEHKRSVTKAEASVPSVSAQSLFCNASNSETAVNSPDSGVSISPPSNSISLDLPSEMEEDVSAAGLSSSSTPTAATFQHPTASFSGNPFSLFYPSYLPSPVPAAPETSTLPTNHGLPQPSPIPKHYANSASAAYTRAWLEQNNNVIVTSPAAPAPAPIPSLPPLPASADDDMDL
ncbi:hypothetical protein FHG87_002848 [Trinorchestia longiramus]|nr:hypothetical protein FHG87_002848 [Trinorchestia longiramus]